MITLFDNAPNQPFKFSEENWFEINDNSHGTYNANSQIKSKITMSRSTLSDYRWCIYLVEGTVTSLKT